MNNILSLTFILTTLLFAIWLSGFAPDARTKWELIYGAEEMEKIYAMASDGHRLYGYTKHGVFISPDDGYTWRPTGLNHAVITFAVGWDGAVYANGGHKHGLFRSDTHGDTWKQINDGLHAWEQDDGSLQFPSLVQILPTTSRSLIAIAHTGAYVSHNRGDSWQWVGLEWVYRGHPGFEAPYTIGFLITTMTEFDGYLWAYTSAGRVYRSSDNGKTWDKLHGHPALLHFLKGHDADINHWVVLNNRLYVATGDAFGVWNEGEFMWENRSKGLPVDNRSWRPAIYDIDTVVVNRGRIFAGVRGHGVWMFNEQSETWFSIGLEGRYVQTLVSHQSELYALTREGIYRATISTVQPYGKAVTTWGATKQK